MRNSCYSDVMKGQSMAKF